jgi:hypothetical protein
LEREKRRKTRNGALSYNSLSITRPPEGGRAQRLCRHNVYGSASGFVYGFALVIVYS